MTEEEKAAIEKAKAEAQEAIQKMATDAVDGVVKGEIETLQKSFKEQFERAATIEAVETIKKSLNDDIAKLQANLKAVRQTSMVVKSNAPFDKQLSERMSSIIVGNKDKLIALKENGGSASMDVSKAVTADSFGVGGFDTLTNENTGLYQGAYAPMYLRNIFPNIATSGSNISVVKRGAVTGAAAKWERGTGDAGVDVAKPNISPTYTVENIKVDWIAGTVDIEREVLDDVDFMATEIPYTLLYGPNGILAAENAMIMAYIEANNTAFTPVGGAFDSTLESLIAAGYGQLLGNYMQPTHVLINNWDYLRYASFNKADATGEYTYPELNIAYINNQLLINGMQAVPTPAVDQGEAYVISAPHSRYVSRQGIQMRASEEHSDNFTKNMITYRAEVRGAFFTYDDNSIVKVTVPTPAGE